MQRGRIAGNNQPFDAVAQVGRGKINQQPGFVAGQAQEAGQAVFKVFFEAQVAFSKCLYFDNELMFNDKFKNKRAFDPSSLVKDLYWHVAVEEDFAHRQLLREAFLVRFRHEVRSKLFMNLEAGADNNVWKFLLVYFHGDGGGMGGVRKRNGLWCDYWISPRASTKFSRPRSLKGGVARWLPVAAAPSAALAL